MKLYVLGRMVEQVSQHAELVKSTTPPTVHFASDEKLLQPLAKRGLVDQWKNRAAFSLHTVALHNGIANLEQLRIEMGLSGALEDWFPDAMLKANAFFSEARRALTLAAHITVICCETGDEQKKNASAILESAQYDGAMPMLKSVKDALSAVSQGRAGKARASKSK